ncbi:MAG: TonB-dependent receptor plug domain-containing protein [Gammaproteobacteria bacterium]|nr:TonB-dependent receptor plug domain-containing protein [Gammaproteobacteria bacterium]
MISSRRIILITCLQFLIFTGASHAADGAFSDMPVVLSDDTLETPPSRSPVAISSIDRDMIEASGARTIPDVLRLIPGIVVGHSVNDFGDKPLLVVAYHGHSDQFSKQMNVLIDVVPFMIRCSAASTGTTYPSCWMTSNALKSHAVRMPLPMARTRSRP